MSGAPGPTPPIVVTSQGAQPQAPATLNAQIISGAQALSPGLTADLPGSLIEDISSTDTSAAVLMDNARVESINSLTPYGANVFTLAQLGVMLGVPIGGATNTSVSVVFTVTAASIAQPGYVIPGSFVVSDGSYQYQLGANGGGVTDSEGNTLPLLAVATQAGTWSIAAGTVTQVVTSVPVGYTVTVTNPLGGTPGQAAQTEWDYRAQVLQANLATAQGTSRFLKTLLGNVPGVPSRLISLRQSSGTGTEVVVGGGDPYLVGYAVWQAIGPAFNSLVGSTMQVTNITNATLGVVTIALTTAGLLAGATVTINGVVGMLAINGVPTTINMVLDDYHFSVNTNTAAFGTYVSGGVVTPNPRNALIPINDYPDVYYVPFVIPPSQVVTMVATWNTNLTNFTGSGAVQQLAVPALVSYINAIPVGQPILVNLLEETFAAAVGNVLPTMNLTRLVFAVSIDGTGVEAQSGTFEILGDPESFFTASPTAAVVVQG
jgi:Ubiquitin-activating enzyme E1 FCCH domain